MQGLKLHLDYADTHDRRGLSSGDMDFAQADAWASAYSAVAAGAALVAGLGVLAFLRRSSNWTDYLNICVTASIHDLHGAAEGNVSLRQDWNWLGGRASAFYSVFVESNL